MSQSQNLRQQLLVVLAAGFVFFLNLGVPHLWDEDEPKNAECAREMYARGDLVVPTFNDQLRTDKPILLYWLMMAAYHVGGVSEFTARFWSALLSVGTVLITYQIGRVLFRPEVGLWGALALSANVMFAVAARAATPDATLIFCTTLSLFCFARGIANTDAPAGTHWRLPWSMALAMYAAIGFAILAKGPAGIVLPGGVMLMYLWCLRMPGLTGSVSAAESTFGTTAGPTGDVANSGAMELVAAKSPHPTLFQRAMVVCKVCCSPAVWWASTVRMLGCVRSLRPMLGLLVVGCIALPWYVIVGIQTDGQWLAGFLGNHNVGRFLQPMENHSGPIVYYIPAVLIGFFPWSVLLPIAFVQCVNRVRRTRDAGSLFLVAWAGVYLVFFSLARTKLPSYVLPCYPALALMAGHFVTTWLSQREAFPLCWRRVAFGSGAVVGVLFCLGVPVAAAIILKGDLWIGAAGLILLAGNGMALLLTERLQAERAVRVFAVTSSLFVAALFGIVAPCVDRHQTSEQLTAVVLQPDSTAQLATYDYFRPSLVFYACRAVPNLHELSQAIAHLEQPGAYLITHEEGVAPLAEKIPGGIDVIQRRPMFLRPRHEVVLVRSRTRAVTDHAIPGSVATAPVSDRATTARQ